MFIMDIIKIHSGELEEYSKKNKVKRPLGRFFDGENMEILNTNELKNSIINKLENSIINNKILILSMNPNNEEKSYKNFIIKKCEQFNIKYVDKEFQVDTNLNDIIAFTNSFDENDGFILLLPFNKYKNLDKIREGIKIKDLDGFTYNSQGKALNGFIDYLPATPQATARFLESIIEIKGKNIVIANNTNLIGLPLATYLSKKGASISILNEFSKNQKTAILESDIFISAIGRANYFDNSYFKDGQILIDVGTSVVNGMIVGDINYDDLKDLDLKVLTSKRGIGALTTLTLIQSLID